MIKKHIRTKKTKVNISLIHKKIYMVVKKVTQQSFRYWSIGIMNTQHYYLHLYILIPVSTVRLLPKYKTKPTE